MPQHLETQFDSLQKLTSFREFNLPDGYAIVPQVAPGWKDSPRRLLFIIESMDSVAIKNGDLFASWEMKGQEQNAMIATVRNTLAQSWSLYQEYLGINIFTQPQAKPDFTIGFVNFNAAKYFHLEGTQRSNVLAHSAKRVQEIVARLKPTDVVVFGDTAARYLVKVEDPALLPFQRGWVHQASIGSHPCRVTTTLDLEPLYNAGRKLDTGDDDDDLAFGDESGIADLLYFVCRNLMNAYAGKLLHSIADVKPKAVMVDTIEKFDKLMVKLMADENEVFSFDLETAGLEAYNNTFYTHQFSFDTTKSYVLVHRHPRGPFTPEECDYIDRKLKRFWRAKKKRLVIGVNIQFDLKVVRAQLGVRVIHYDVWDVTAGESMLDENLALFDGLKWRVGENQVKTTMGNLKNLTLHYGNDFYAVAAFSKEQRATIGFVDICNDKAAQAYCAADTQFPLAIYYQQLERAKKIRLFPKSTFLARYRRHVLHQMSNTVHGISHMHQAGSHLDRPYLTFLTSKQSPLLGVIRDMGKEMLTLPEVMAANKRLLKEHKMQAGGLFGSKPTVIFEPTKPAHKQLLYFDVMGLKPVSMTDGGAPAVDKVFFKAYASKHKAVEYLEHIQKASKLLGTYVKGWLRIMSERADPRDDDCLRPSFGFFGVVTGRLNSFDPSLHQTPSRGPSAKYIKRAFTPRKGCLNWNYDYSAQEVRQWSVLSGDTALAAAFKAGQRLRQLLLLSPGDPDIKAKLKKEGDVHIQNVFRFFGIWVDKEHPLRDAIKSVVFGVIYGKSAASLANDIRNDAKEQANLEQELKAAQEAGNKTKIREAKDALASLAADPKAYWVEKATGIMEKMYSEFPQGKAFLDNCVEQVQRHGWLISPIGRRRNLYRVFTGKRKYLADAARRAKNSPIQGFSSELGITAGYLVLPLLAAYMDMFKDAGYTSEDMPHYCRVVHDASYNEVPYAMTIPYMHITQYTATYGLANYYKEVFGTDFTVEPEIELEVSASADKSYKWSWELPQLVVNIKKALKDQVDLKQIAEDEVPGILDTIFAPWKDPKQLAYLQEHYPILGMKDPSVLKQIRALMTTIHDPLPEDPPAKPAASKALAKA